MNKNSKLRALGLLAVAGGSMLAASSCREGNLTEDFDTQQTRDFSGIAEIADPAGVQPIELHERSSWGTALSADALAYPTATSEERHLYDFGTLNTPLQFFATPHTDEEGVGPRFNQRMCLGCHQSSEENRDNMAAGATVSAPGMINTVNTPVSRANRKGLTNHAKITKAFGNPPTAAFTLYGDYGPSSGAFFGLEAAGGPLLHVQAAGDCEINMIPPASFDPITQGPPDPVTGLTPTGLRRAVGERGAPPYVARGAIEAIYFADILANEDQNDTFKGNSTLLPSPDPLICPGDCVSGRHNEGRGADAFIGGDPVVRLGRFGVRGTGPTMLQFDIGGTQGEIGLTSAFSPVEQPMYNNPNKQCDFVPDPEIATEVVLGLRDMLRNIAPPRQANELYEDPPVSQVAIDVQEGARLFGVDLPAFRSRMTPGATPVNLGNFDADHGIAVDRQLGCASCHTPIMRTGKSPAKIGGQHLTNRWLPIFSDLLIHKNPDLPFESVQFRPQHRPPGNISRDLGDFAIPPGVTGLANGTEFRTPPLMGLGKVGPPFFHDSRVYVNILGTGNYPGDPPNPPASTVFTSKDGGTNILKDITSFDLAVLAAIELHDLPAPPENPNTKLPDYAMCRVTLPPFDICSRNSQYRGEARNTMEKFRALTSAQQMQVVKFLLAL
jgi:CxxC motif-containing protein (DUF1111 family)